MNYRLNLTQFSCKILKVFTAVEKFDVKRVFKTKHGEDQPISYAIIISHETRSKEKDLDTF